MPRPILTTPMKRMLLRFADAGSFGSERENGPGWNFTLQALSARGLITLVPHGPGGNSGKFVISEEGRAEASRIHASNARQSRTT